MTDQDDKQPDEELVLDWDDAVDSWGQGMDKSAKAEAAPFPTRIDVNTDSRDVSASVFESPTLPPGGLHTDPAPPPAIMSSPPSMRPSVPPLRRMSSLPASAEVRPRMYRPPTIEEIEALRKPSARPASEMADTRPPPPPTHDEPDISYEDEYGPDSDATQIAAIPRELIESLIRAESTESDYAERPERKSDSVSVNLDEDVDVDISSFPDDAGASPLGSAREGSGVFAPSSVPPPHDQRERSGAARLTFRHEPSYEEPEEEGDPTRIVDLAAEGIEIPTRTRPPPPPVPPPPPPAVRSERPRAPATPTSRPPEHSVLHNLDELAPPSVPARPVMPAPSVVAPGPDRGAATAMRTVRSRKPRRESLPLAALDDTGRRARLTLLQALADKASGARRAALLVQAAELCEEREDPESAQKLYEQAVESDAQHVPSVRALARLALRSADFARYVEGLERLAGLASDPRERAEVLHDLALVRWLLDGDLPAALRAATEAERLAPDTTAHALLLSRIELACVTPDANVSLEAMASRTRDKSLRATLLTIAARVREAKGELQGAHSAYRVARELDPTLLEAHLGEARASRSIDGKEGPEAALQRGLRLLAPDRAQAAMRRSAAAFVGVQPEARDQALALLQDATDAPSLRTAARLAYGSGEAEQRVLTAWSEATHGIERALALVTLAEERSKAGDGQAADECLARAHTAAPELALIAVVREMLARGRGDTKALAEAAASDESGHGALTAAAKMGADTASVAREAAWLLQSQRAATEPYCTEALLLDASAEAREMGGVSDVLRLQLARAAPHARVSSLLALQDVARRHDRGDDVLTELQSATEVDGRNIVLLRAYARARAHGSEFSRTFRREAEVSEGARAAFAFLRAGFALSDDHEGRLGAFAAAYEASSSYLPSVWALHQEARRSGDLDRLHDLHAREAGRAKDSHETVAHLVRAALVRAGSDTDAAAVQLARGLDLMPTDPVLRELVIRLGDAVPATLRAEAMQRMAEHAPPALERPALLSAAGAFEDANQPARAASLYEAVLAREPHDPIADMGFERVAFGADKLEELLESKRRALGTAQTDAARLKALEDLVDLDTEAEPELSLVRAQQMLEIVPNHPAALRRVERQAMQMQDVATLFTAEARMLQSSKGPRDRTARLRVLSVLAGLREDGEQANAELDALVLETAAGAHDDAWLGRLLFGSAAALNDREGIVRALGLLLDRAGDAHELVTLTLQRARLLLGESPEGLDTQIQKAAEQSNEHPLLDETLGDIFLALKDPKRASERFEAAAQAALDPKRRARLFYQAGKLYQDELRSPDRARDALRKAAEADLGYGDVQKRLEGLLTGRNDFEGLITLTETRIRAGGPPAQLAELHRQLAKLYERRGDKADAKRALDDAQAIDPDNLAVLRDVAEAHEREGNHRECAESLIRIARLSRDPVELRETFFKLGEIYDLHLPDARRAEAAYRRVLKLGPRHVKALERLSALYKREGQRELASEALERLLAAVESPARRREVAFELAKLKEDHGDPRGAEETLESLRRQSPQDLYVLRGLADFYRRNHAHSALAMHLNRAVNDLRQAVEADFDDAGLWKALVEMLDERQRRDAARACASAAFALGLADQAVAQHTDNEGNVPGVGGAAFSELLDDLVFPDNMPSGARILFRYGAEAFNKVAPFDVRLVGGEKIDKKHPLRAVVQEMSRWVNAGDIEIYATPQLPFAFVPVGDGPIQLLVGRTLLDALSRGEQQFLVARALKIARAQMSITCRIRPDEMGLMLLALVRLQAPELAPEGLDLAALDDMTRRVHKQVSKRAREDLLPHLMELAGASDFDPAHSYYLASTAGNRAGLLATGSLPSALSALAKLAGVTRERTTATIVAQVEEARDLLRFAISESHFEARQRAGADRR